MPSKRCTATCCAHRAPAPEAKSARPLTATGLAGFTDAKGVIVDTTQLVLDQPENQPQRADLAKMLVHRSARRQGLAERLLRAAEDAARARGKTLLVLDTASGDAERLYERLGWTRVGVVPGFALLPDGAAL